MSHAARQNGSTSQSSIKEADAGVEGAAREGKVTMKGDPNADVETDILGSGSKAFGASQQYVEALAQWAGVDVAAAAGRIDDCRRVTGRFANVIAGVRRGQTNLQALDHTAKPCHPFDPVRPSPRVG